MQDLKQEAQSAVDELVRLGWIPKRLEIKEVARLPGVFDGYRLIFRDAGMEPLIVAWSEPLVFTAVVKSAVLRAFMASTNTGKRQANGKYSRS